MKHVIKAIRNGDCGLVYTVYDSDINETYTANLRELRKFESKKQLQGIDYSVEDFEHRYTRYDKEDVVLLHFIYKYKDYTFVTEYGTIWVYKNCKFIRKNRYTLFSGFYTLEDKDVLWFPEGRSDDYISVVSYDCSTDKFRRYFIGTDKVRSGDVPTYKNKDIGRTIFRVGIDNWRDEENRKVLNIRNERDVKALDKTLAIYYPKLVEDVEELYKEIIENLIRQRKNFLLQENLCRTDDTDSRLQFFSGFVVMTTYLLNAKLLERRKEMTEKLGLFNIRYDIDGEYQRKGDLIKVYYTLKLQGTALLFMNEDTFPALDRCKTLLETRSLETWEVV